MPKQLALNIYKGKHGGRRPNSGRPRIHSKGVSHRRREKVTRHTPLHINFKLKLYIRNKLCLKLLKRAIQNARSQGLGVIHYSLQSNHVHFIIEAKSNLTLTRGMRSLTITFAKGLKEGRVQLERYHLHVLRTPRETKNAVQYVLFNEQKHSRLRVLRIDVFTSLQNYQVAKSFIKRERLRLIWDKGKEKTHLDPGESFLLKRTMIQLNC